MPKHSSKGILGVIELTQKIEKLWNEDKDRVIEQAERLFRIIQSKAHVAGNVLAEEDCIAGTAEIFFKIADPLYGGMKGAPKFPLGYHTTFLLNYYLKRQDSRALFLVEKTLEMMYRGAIRDHIGGGFCRYAADDRWQVPHFEKMLFDNAILAKSYLDAWRVTGRTLYRQVAEETCEYILRELKNPEGAFYTAEDSDSSGIEGLFYTWTEEEISSVLGNDKEFFLEFYGITDEGNFRDRSLLFMDVSEEEYAGIRGISLEEFESYLAGAREKLYNARQKRPRPSKDEKIITCYNGMAIHSLALCGFYLGEEKYLMAAVEAAQFIRKHLYRDKALLRRFCHDESRFDAILDDYAYLIQGLITLFETGCGKEWLWWACELCETLEKNFKAPDGAYYVTDGNDPTLLIRKCHFSDGAEPSGNAIHEENLLRLYELTGKQAYLTSCEDCFKALKYYLDIYPLGYCYHLISLDRYYNEKKARISIFLNEKAEFKNEIIEALTHKAYPHQVLVFRYKDDGLDALLHELPRAEYPKQTEVSICRSGVCKKVLSSREEILHALKEL